ncbi:AraC family transcriptional regulator [Paenibacillus dendritiformis C454]|uniref:AraC family transcriptional regulator n=1 Tax=Paenibacillus dendritiformis C454 TaxID=1131935 RepID=H3S9H4_9BACL|nr:helix-turn-helix domain-containing protein [Paenibacillus dendritiformis]EHQ64422.1 AraC family transcriptional regulator [Paenibacillus dendritiformis C454]
MRSIVNLLLKLRKRSLSRVLTAMIVSNLCLLLIPVTMGLFLYTMVEDVLENNARRSNSAMLEQLRLSMDHKLKELDILAKQVAFNPKLTALLSSSGTASEESYKQVEFVRDYLNRYQSFASGFVKDFYVHLQAGDLILKPGLRTDATTFYEKYYAYAEMDAEAWRSGMLDGYHSMTYLPSAALLQDPVNGGSPAKVITYVQSLPIYEVSGTRGSLVILIDEQKVQEMFKQIELANDSTIFIVNHNREIIAATDPDLEMPDEMADQLAKGSGLFNYAWNGTDSIVSYTSSAEAGWHYVSVMPKDRFMQRVESMKQIALFVLIVALGCGGATAYWIAYRHYSPVKRMVDAIIQGKPDRRRPGNEYEFIRESIEGTLLEEKHLRSRLLQQAPVIRSNFLSRLIRGYVDLDREPLESQLDFLNMEFLSDRFAVFIVQAEDITGYANPESEAKWTQIRFIISNIGTDMIQARHIGYAVELERDRIGFLCNFDPALAEDHAKDLQEMTEQLLDMMHNRFRISLTIAVSDIHEGPAQIGHAYLEALAAFDYRMFRGRNAVIHFGEIQDVTPHYYYPLEFEAQLVNHVKSGDTENVGKLLDNIYEMNFNAAKTTFELGMCLFFNIMSTFLKITNSTNTDHAALLGPNIDPIKNLFNYKTVEEMHAETKRLFVRLTASFQTAQSDHSKQLLADIMQMIDLHLHDQNLGLVMIADHFGMTPQYVSSFFKKASNQNLTDYITRARIDLAKAHMAQSDLTNAQLAQMVGYTNDVVFIRAFKKLEGVTPGKYRISIQRSSRERDKEANL